MPVFADSSYDAVARLAAVLLHAPIAFVSLRDDGTHTLVGAHGLVVPGPVEDAFSARVVREENVVIEEGAQLLVGAPIRAANVVRGALVVVAPEQGTIAEQIELLELVARQAGELISKQRFAVIFEAIDEGIVLHDRDGKVLSMNPAAERILGSTLSMMTSDEALSSWRFINEEGGDFPVETHPAWKTLQTGEPQTNVVMGLVRPSGEVSWLAVNSRPLPGIVIVTFRDITVLKSNQLASERLARQEHLVTTGTLAAGVGHEINNPLAAILANLELAIDEVRAISGGSPAGRLRDLLTVLAESRDGVDRIRTIVRGLRSLAREGEPPTPTDIETAAQIALNMAAHETRRRASVTTDFAGVPPVLADESRLTQVIVNLVVNAAQSFAHGNVESNRIELRSRLEGGNVVIEVTDNGPGISPETQRRIFDPFFTTKPVGQGSGLGLSISRSIVTALGGELGVTSQVGVGSTFRLSLPATIRRKLTAPPPSPDAVEVRGRILIVDDEPAVLAALRRALERDHEVVACGDPRDAAVHIERGETFDVVFCDLMMPAMNGNDLYELAHGKDPGLADRFVFITGGATQTHLKEFLDDIPNERMEKPFSIQNIRAIARRYATARKT